MSMEKEGWRGDVLSAAPGWFRGRNPPVIAVRLRNHSSLFRPIGLTFAPLMPVCPAKEASRLFFLGAATPPNLGGEFHSDASRHSGNLIAPAGGTFACTVVNVLNSYDKSNRLHSKIWTFDS